MDSDDYILIGEWILGPIQDGQFMDFVGQFFDQSLILFFNL